jgi:hypothetical protein
MKYPILKVHRSVWLTAEILPRQVCSARAPFIFVSLVINKETVARI